MPLALSYDGIIALREKLSAIGRKCFCSFTPPSGLGVLRIPRTAVVSAAGQLLRRLKWVDAHLTNQMNK